MLLRALSMRWIVWVWMECRRSCVMQALRARSFVPPRDSWHWFSISSIAMPNNRACRWVVGPTRPCTKGLILG